MTLLLLRIDVGTGESRTVGHARSVTDAAKQLMRLAKQEARSVGPDAEVVKEKGGYCVKLDPDRLALFMFEDVPSRGEP